MGFWAACAGKWIFFVAMMGDAILTPHIRHNYHQSKPCHHLEETIQTSFPEEKANAMQCNAASKEPRGA